MEIEKLGKDFFADEMVGKLILLFVFEKMEFPLTEESLNNIIREQNPSWMTYMDFIVAREALLESKFVFRAMAGSEISWGITRDGRECLGHFFTKIPASVREEITEYARENRQKFKRRQEYMWDYSKNTDGTYMVRLKIKDTTASDNLLDICFKTPTRAGAKRASVRWREIAAQVYEHIHHTLVDEEEEEESENDKPL